MEIKITVRLDETGNISVDGPLDNKILCYGLLEAAKDAIKAFEPKKIIQPVMKIVGNM